MRGSRSIELARLKKERKKKKNDLAVLLLFGWVLLRCFLALLWVLLVRKTLKDELHVVIKAYKFTVFDIWRDFNVLSYIACLCYPYIRVYRLYDSTSHSHGLSSVKIKPLYICMHLSTSWAFSLQINLNNFPRLSRLLKKGLIILAWSPCQRTTRNKS